jgi:hypothetical protein
MFILKKNLRGFTLVSRNFIGLASILGIFRSSGLIVRGFKFSAVSYINNTIYKPDKVYSNDKKNIINSVVTYSNADLMKHDILKNNKNKSGIYR